MMPRTARRDLPPFSALLLCPFLAAAPALAQPDDLNAWRVVKTSNFTIHTNASAERGAEIAVSLELFRSVFARLAPALELRSPAPTKILAFRDARSYAPYKTRPDREGARVLGQFLSHPDGNYLTIDAGTRLVSSYAVIYHEYVHYFVRHNFPGVPLWFNEGLAEYYSTFAVEDDVVHVGRPVERHVQFLGRDGEVSLGDLLEVTQGSASYHEGEKAGRFYATSWALVHYLLSGDAERLDQMADFLFALQEGEEPYDAFEEAFDTRVSSLEEALNAYVLAAEYPRAAFSVRDINAPSKVHKRRARPQDVAFHLGDLLVHMGRRHQAEQHFQGALDLDPDHPEAHAGLAYVRDLGGRFGEAGVLYRDAVAVSYEPLPHLQYGRHLLQRIQRGDGEAAELAAAARTSLARAIDLNDGFAEAYALFGAAHLYGDVDSAPGVAALEKARAWLPERHDVTVRLVELHLKDHEFGRAQWLLENALERRAGDEMVFKVREAIDRARLLYGASKALEDEDVERAVELFDEAISVTSDPELRERMEDRLRALQESHGLR